MVLGTGQPIAPWRDACSVVTSPQHVRLSLGRSCSFGLSAPLKSTPLAAVVCSFFLLVRRSALLFVIFAVTGAAWAVLPAAAQQDDMQPFPTAVCDLPAYIKAADARAQWYAKGPMEISDCVYKNRPSTASTYLLINMTTACSNATFDIGRGGTQVCSFVFRRVFFQNAVIVFGTSSNHTLSAMPRVLVLFEDCVFHAKITDSFYTMGFAGLRNVIYFGADADRLAPPLTELNFTVTGCIFRTEYVRTISGVLIHEAISSSAVCISSILGTTHLGAVVPLFNANISIVGNSFFVTSTHPRGSVSAVAFQGFDLQSSLVNISANFFAIRGEVSTSALQYPMDVKAIMHAFVVVASRWSALQSGMMVFNGSEFHVDSNIGSIATRGVDAYSTTRTPEAVTSAFICVTRGLSAGATTANVLGVRYNTIIISFERSHRSQAQTVRDVSRMLYADVFGALMAFSGRFGNTRSPYAWPHPRSNEHMPVGYRLLLLAEGNSLNATAHWQSKAFAMAASALVVFTPEYISPGGDQHNLHNIDLVVMNNVWSNLVEFGAFLDIADTPPAYRSMLVGFGELETLENCTIIVAGNTVARNDLRFPNASNIISGPLTQWHEVGFWGIAFFDAGKALVQANRWGGLEQYPVTITLENNTMVAQILSRLTGTPPFALSCALVLLSNGTANHATEVLQAPRSGLRIAGNTFSLRADLPGAPYATSAPLPLLAGLLASPRLPRAVLVGNELTVSIDAPQLLGGTPRALSPALAMWHLRTISTTDTTAYMPLGARWHIEGNRVNFSTGAMLAGSNASDAVAIVQLGGAMVLNNASIAMRGNALTFDSGANATRFSFVGGNSSLIALAFLNGTRAVVGCETKRGWAGPAVEDPLQIVRPPLAEAWPFAPFGCGNTVRVRGLHVTNGGLWAFATGSQSVELANGSHFSFAGNAMTLEASASVRDAGGGGGSSDSVFAVVPAAFDRVGPGTRLFIVRNTVELLASNPFPSDGDVALVRVGAFAESAGGTAASAASETWFVVCDNRAVLGPGVANQGRRSFAAANGGGRHFVGIAFGAHTSLSAATATRTHVELSRNVFALSGMNFPNLSAPFPSRWRLPMPCQVAQRYVSSIARTRCGRQGTPSLSTPRPMPPVGSPRRKIAAPKC